MSGTSVVPFQAKRKPEMRPAIDTHNEVIDPLDFSFFRMTNILDAKDEGPRLSPRGKGKRPAQSEACKSGARCLKLNNNSITNLEGLKMFIEVKFANWQDIAWIDLSYNDLTKLGSDLTEFVNLQILYLHGNQIADHTELDKLVHITTLRKLTLHGNPVEKTKGYRLFILNKIPQLQAIDFNSVTKAERKTASTWDRMNSWGIKKKKKIEKDE